MGSAASIDTSTLRLSPFTFENKGELTRVSGTNNKETDDVSIFREDAPGIALALTVYKGSSWGDGRYNSMDFTIQSGLVGSFRAYKIDGPKTKFKQFQASQNTIWLSFEKAGDYKIYLLDDTGTLTEEGSITSPEGGKFIKTNMLADSLKTLVIAPASARVSNWPLVAPGVEFAVVWQDKDFTIKALRYDVSIGQPYNPSKNFLEGPSSWKYRYGTWKRFFPVFNSGIEGVVWQDKDSNKIFLSWLVDNFLSISHVELPTKSVVKPVLQAAAGNGKGEV